MSDANPQIPAKKRGRPAKDPSKAKKKTSVAKLLKQKALEPNLTQQQLAAINGVSKQAVSQMFKRYGINDKFLDSFKTHRADIFAGIQETVAASLTSGDINSASIKDRTILLGTLYDKERLERGLSTQNSAVILASAVIEADEGGKKPVDNSLAPQDVVSEPIIDAVLLPDN